MRDQMTGFNKPKTVVITVEVEYQNGDKDILRTTELDAGAIIENHNKRHEWNHLLFGLSTEDSDQLYNWPGLPYFNPSPEYFTMSVSLRKSSDSKDDWVYQIQHIEKPSSRMFFRVFRPINYHPHGEYSLIVQTGTEEEVQRLAEQFPSAIFFMAEVPE